MYEGSIALVGSHEIPVSRETAMQRTIGDIIWIGSEGSLWIPAPDHNSCNRGFNLETSVGTFDTVRVARSVLGNTWRSSGWSLKKPGYGEGRNFNGD